MSKETLTHVNPDFTVKSDEKEVEAARKKVEGLREKEAKLVEDLNAVRKEINAAGTLRSAPEPGFSNAKPAAEQRKATETANPAPSPAKK